MSVNSKDVAWTFRHEVFRFLASSFDVDAAKRLLQNSPRYAQQFDVVRLASMGLLLRVERAQVFRSDLSFPIILATIAEGFLPIDGWHRIALAMQLRRNRLPGFLLSEEETRQIRWMAVPK